MNLVNSGQSITVQMGGAKTTTEAAITIEYQDIVLNTSLSSPLPGPQIGNNALTTAGATPVTALAAAKALVTGGTATVPRQMTFMSIVNADTVSQTFTIVFVYSGSLSNTLATVTLLTGEQMIWTPQEGFKAYTASGTVKGATGAQAATYSAFTDNTGGTPGTTLAVNAIKQTIVIPVGLLASLVNTTTYQVSLPFAFTVLSAQFHTDVPATTSAKAATLTVSTNAGSVTGGVMSLTSANQTPTGAAVAATAISGANATDIATHNLIVTVSAVTAFVEGSGHIEITVSNNDLANTISSIATQFNTVRTNLRAAALVA